MLKYAIIILAGALLLAGTACDKIKIPGNVAGQILDENGAPRGLVSVQLVLVETGEVVLQETADDRGNYFFSKVDPGKYKIVTIWGRDKELPNDTEEFTLPPGKTLTKTVTVLKADENAG